MINKIEKIMNNNNNNYRNIYEKYLTTPCPQWNGVVALPTKQKTSTAIMELGDKYNDDIGSVISDYIARGKNVWLWSDLHFYHKNICKHANRPFDNMEDMHSAMIKGYYSTVGEEDLVIFGGDIAFGQFAYVDQLISSFPGTKALIIGNHDFNFKNMKPINYHCFQYTNSFAFFEIEVQGVKKNILLTHYPLNLESLPKNTINIHGHTHQHLMGTNRINISVEHTEYKPKSLNSILESQ